MKYYLVEINNKYAIKRKGFGITTSYLDMDNGSGWWREKTHVHKWCLSEDYDKVERLFNILIGKEKIIKQS